MNEKLDLAQDFVKFKTKSMKPLKCSYPHTSGHHKFKPDRKTNLGFLVCRFLSIGTHEDIGLADRDGATAGRRERERRREMAEREQRRGGR